MKRYTEYKNSGVEWIGEIPNEWEVKKLKYVSDEPLMYGANESGDEDNFEYPRYIRITDIDENGNLRNDTFKSLSPDKATPYLIKKGDILFARSGASVGKTYFHDSDEKSCFAGYLIKLSTNLKILAPKYIYYIAQSDRYENWIKESTIQATIQNVSAEKYNNFFITFPPLQTQRVITDYLDRKTAGIDALIADKQKLIDLLREKRQATISEAVTKGLDKTAKMKDSGIEWIGEIPENWEIKKLKTVVTKIGSGKTPKGGNEVYVDSGVMFLRSQNIHNEGLFIDDVAYITDDMDKDLSNTRLLENDVLLNITGASIGRACIWDLHDVRGNVNQHVCIIRVGAKIASKFLHYILISSIGQISIDIYQTGANREGLNFEEIAKISIPFTRIQEQQEIIDYLDRKTAQIDSLISDITEQIEKLKEYRQSIISEVVTGKVAV